MKNTYSFQYQGFLCRVDESAGDPNPESDS